MDKAGGPVWLGLQTNTCLGVGYNKTMVTIDKGHNKPIYRKGSTALADQLKSANAIAAVDLGPRHFAIIGADRTVDNPYKIFRLVVRRGVDARTEVYHAGTWTTDMYYTKYL